MAAGGFNVTIGLTDGITRPLEALNKRIAAINAPLNRLQGAMTKFGDVTGISKIVNGMKSLGSHVIGVLGSVMRLLPAMAGLTGATSIAGVGKLLTSWGVFGTKLLNTSAVLGTTTSRLQELEGAAKLAGVSAGDMDSAIAGLSASMQSALSGNNADAINLFQRYGVNIREAGFQAKNGAEKMQAAFDILKSSHDMGDSADVTRQKAAILGIPDALIRMAESGKLASAIEMYNHLGNPLTPTQVKQADEFREAMERVGIAVGGLINSFTTAVGPAMTPLLHRFAEWLKSIQGPAFDQFTEWMKQLTVWAANDPLGDIHKRFDTITKDVVALTTAIKGLINLLGGFENASMAALSIWGIVKTIGIAGALGGGGAWAARFMKMSSMAGMDKEARLDRKSLLPSYERYKEAFKSSGKTPLPFDTYAKQQTNMTQAVKEASRLEKLQFMVADAASAIKWLAALYVFVKYMPPILDKGLGWLMGIPDGPRPNAQGGSGGRSLGNNPVGMKDRGSGKHASGPNLKALQREEFDFWKSQGKSDEFAAGMAAQATAESGMNPGERGDYVNGSPTAGGLYQMHKDRRQKIFDATGIDMWNGTADQQRRGAAWELEHSEKAAGDALAGAKTPEEGGSIGSLRYERPGLTDEAKKAAAAHRALIARGIYDANVAARKASQDLHTPFGSQRNPELNGKVDVTVTHVNPPPGATVTATGSGVVGPPKIQTPLPAGV